MKKNMLSLALSILVFSTAQAATDSSRSSRNYDGAGYATAYCRQRGNIADCQIAGEIAGGLALSECYNAGNSICGIQLVNVTRKSGSCAELNDRCEVHAIAVPHKVNDTTYVGDFYIE